MVGPLPCGWRGEGGEGVHEEEVRERERGRRKESKTLPDEDRRGRIGRRSGIERVLRGSDENVCIVHGGAGAAPRRPFVETQLSQWLP